MPKTFEYYIDKKVTSWVREYHKIDAENKNDADKIMIENFKKQDTDNSFFEQDSLHGTEEYISLDENSGYATEELYGMDGDFIIDNRKTT